MNKMTTNFICLCLLLFSIQIFIIINPVISYTLPQLNSKYCNNDLVCGPNALCINNYCICQFGYNATDTFTNCTLIQCQDNLQCPTDGQCIDKVCQCSEACAIDDETQVCYKQKDDTLNLLIVLPIVIIPLAIIVCFAFRLHNELLKTGQLPERVGWRQYINWPFDWPDRSRQQTQRPSQIAIIETETDESILTIGERNWTQNPNLQTPRRSLHILGSSNNDSKTYCDLPPTYDELFAN